MGVAPPSTPKEKKNIYSNYSKESINKNVAVHTFCSTFLLSSSLRHNNINGQVF